MVAYVTICLDDDELVRARKLAEARGLSVEEWASETIRRSTLEPSDRPRDSLFGLHAHEPELTDAIDEVVAERYENIGRSSSSARTS